MDCSAAVYVSRKPLKRTDLAEGAEGIGLLAGDEVHARYRMENGWTAYFDSIKDAGDGGAGFGLEIIGSKGVVNLRVDREPFAYFKRGNPFDTSSETGDWEPISTGGVGVPEPVKGLGKLVGSHYLAGVDLVESILEDREPIVTGEQGLMVMEMICGAWASHFAGGRVTLPLEDRG